MFVPAHPLHAHGLPDELGHQGGIGGRVVGTIVAVAACALGVNDPDRGCPPFGLRMSARASCNGYTPCVPDQTVAWIPLASGAEVTFATAHEGPTEPCIW